ncbi:MAG: F420-dependent oxidoreductase, family [Frankiales bacterium]|nr:F420-dependent oxidoreductase, family [Frankiales bacterium]
MDLGFTLMGEQRAPRDLVRDAVLAEQAGFDFLVASDHFHPWLEEQGHSPGTWPVLGAVAQATSRIPFMTYVTCPILRYHPAVIAQQAATVALLSEGRFSLGVGAGENLNEHVVGRGWPPADIRHQMLRESLEAIRALWEGGWTNYRGTHVQVESAKLFDLPETPVRIGVAASGRQSCTLAADLGDFLIGTEPKPSLQEDYRRAGGTGELVGQFPVVFGTDAAAANTLLRDQFRWGALGWKVQAELPGPAAFDAASQFVRDEDMASAGVWGHDVEPYLARLQDFADVGYTRVALVQVGPDQEAFCTWAAETLLPAVTARFG